MYLVRSVCISSGLPEHQQRHHGSPIEDPGGEAEEVDEGADVGRDDHEQGDNGLPMRGERVVRGERGDVLCW